MSGDFSFTQTSLEYDAKAQYNLAKANNIPALRSAGSDIENESLSDPTKTTVRRRKKESERPTNLNLKKCATSTSTSAGTSVVRSLVERGCQINDSLVEVRGIRV